MATYRMTPARKAALRKAQAASARKRRGKGKGKLAAANRKATRNKRIAVAAVVSATGGLALAGAGVAGAYYAKKLASGGPQPKTISFSGYKKMTPARMNTIRDAQKSARSKRRLPKRIDSGFNRKLSKPFTGDRGFNRKLSKPFTGDRGFYGKR